jgi:hypothetical protein
VARPLLLALALTAACTVRNVSSDPHGNKISMPFQWSIKSSDAFHLTAGPNSGDAALHLESLPAGGPPDQWVSGAQFAGGLGAGFCETTPTATSIVALAALEPDGRPRPENG